MWIERIGLRGLRSFGRDEQLIDLSPGLTIIYADNSQGKTSLAEALEFLLTSTISRRTFTGSAPREFAACLRNVHLAGGEASWIEATLSEQGRAARVLRRELTADFTANRECTSALTIDGAIAPDVTTVLRLSEPPLQTPILLQHSLRYVLSARPQDRTLYYKAILDVTDLDELYRILTSTSTGVERPITPLADRAIGLMPDLRPTGEVAAPSERDLRARTLAEIRGVIGGARGVLDENLERPAREHLAAAEGRHFPFDQVVVGEWRAEAFDEDALARAAQAADVCTAASVAEAALQRFYEASLALPTVAGVQVTADCPLCLTEASLSRARVGDIRRTVAESREVLAATRQLGTEIQTLTRWLDGLPASLQRATPGILSESREAAIAAVDRALLALVLGGESISQIEAWRGRTREFDAALGQVRRDAGAVRDSLRLAEGPGAMSAASSAIRVLRDSLAALEHAHREYRTSFAPIDAAIRARIAEDAPVVRLRDLLALLPAMSELTADLAQMYLHEMRRRFLAMAASQVEGASRSLTDEKFAELSDEILAWWRMMRPDEATAFSGLQRAGTGRRFLDLKAVLGGQPGADAEERDAAAVFSDSQLNCLGLSAFLARVCRDGAPFVVLDDPIQASDDEHRISFVDKVPEALLAAGKQVIILTHDERLAGNLQDRYEETQPAHYRIALQDPITGSVIETVRDSLEVQLNRAGALAMDGAAPEARRRAAQMLRTAAERFCKKVLVKSRRAAGARALLSDYDGQMLAGLTTQASVYLTRDGSHVGKLRVAADVLNPGNHDDGPPASASLRHTAGDLRSLAGQYL